MRTRVTFWLVAFYTQHPPHSSADGTTVPQASVGPSGRQFARTLDRTAWRGVPGTIDSVSPSIAYGSSSAQSRGALEDGAEGPARAVEESQEGTPKHRSVQEVEAENITRSDVLGSIPGTSERGVGHPMPNRCQDFRLSRFGKGQSCGPPLSLPCFDYGRCQVPPEGKLTIYVYDYDCTLADSDQVGHRCCCLYLYV